MSFLRSLFGGGSADGGAGPARVVKEAEEDGFRIEARPYKEGGQYQLAGTISKEIGGVRKEHRFVRADRFSSEDEAAEFALKKGRQLIAERGDKLFD
jgi:hypothetical protein